MNLYFLIVLGATKVDGAEDFLPILSVWLARPQFTQVLLPDYLTIIRKREQNTGNLFLNGGEIPFDRMKQKLQTSATT